MTTRALALTILAVAMLVRAWTWTTPERAAAWAARRGVDLDDDGRRHRGALAPADPLSTVRQLAADLQITPVTVQRAYQALRDQGLLGSRPPVLGHAAPQ